MVVVPSLTFAYVVSDVRSEIGRPAAALDDNPVLLISVSAASEPNGTVLVVDFALFAQHWLDRPCGTANYYCQGADLDRSGSVDLHDLEIFADNWLKGIP